MSMVNWHDHVNTNNILSEDLCAFLLVELISNNTKLDKKLKNGELNPSELNVVLTIDGEEVDFEQACKTIEQQLDSLIMREAQKLIAEKIAEIHNKLVEVEDRVQEILSMD